MDMAMPDPTRPAGKADWPLILKRVLPYVDVFLPSAEELLYMLRRERFDELRRTVGPAHMLDALTPDEISSLAEETLALGTKILAIKTGHRGLYLRTADHLENIGRCGPLSGNWLGRELWAPCFRVNVVNTVGSGDSTIAGFLAGLLKGLDAVQTATSAVAVGACNVEASDSLSGVRPWEETQARIRAGWDRLDAQLDEQATGGAGRWQWDNNLGIYIGPHDQ
jgi:sugar/nucleoside kinase (ribokinase family)